MTTTDARLQETGAAHYASVFELVEGLSGEEQEGATETIREDALEIEVRPPWAGIGDSMPTSYAGGEYRILLCTGGPAIRIVGTLDEHCEPETATLEAQDWFSPWTKVRCADEQVLLAYARCFYFGES